MNGPEIFSFTLSVVQAGVQRLLDRSNLDWDDIDLFLFHQANRFMLERLRTKMKIPEAKLPIDLEEFGNTVSASIPILIRRCLDRAILRPGQSSCAGRLRRRLFVGHVRRDVGRRRARELEMTWARMCGYVGWTRGRRVRPCAAEFAGK